MGLTQCERVLHYMEDFGTINPMQAIQDLGCYRLGARIWDLRHAGHPISRRMVSGKNRYGDSVSYIITPAGSIYDVKEIPHWVFYRRPPEGEADA